MITKQSTRVEKLEKRYHPPVVYASRKDNAPTVRVCDTGEILTVAEFDAKYPDGVVIHIIYVDSEDAESAL